MQFNFSLDILYVYIYVFDRGRIHQEGIVCSLVDMKRRYYATKGKKVIHFYLKFSENLYGPQQYKENCVFAVVVLGQQMGLFREVEQWLPPTSHKLHREPYEE
jgi:hypothetical protein